VNAARREECAKPVVIETARYAQGVTDKADRSAYDDDETDFWLSVPGIRESLIEAEADYAAGRTFNEEEIRTQFGLPPREADRRHRGGRGAASERRSIT
jgi:PHD/YefM family antitoxin component YafN of YafNO toxin-antitoxin module